MNEFIRRYDREIEAHWRKGLFEECGSFNTGYWRRGVRGQQRACHDLVAKLIELLGAGPPARRCLDLACGSGAANRQLRSRAEVVVASDLSLRRLAGGRRRIPETSLCCMDATSLAFATASFDAVVCVEAAFHFDTRADFLREAYRVLEPGGALVLSDILFEDTTLIGDWMVPAGNRIKDLDGYLRAYRQAGFVGLRWRDATDACWRGFCRYRRRLAAVAAGELSAAAHAHQMRFIDQLEHDAVGRYLLVAACKPASK